MMAVEISNKRFKDVQVGDYVWQSDYYAPDKFRKVTAIKNDGKTVMLGVGVSVREDMDTRTYLCGHPDQGIMVRIQFWT